MFNILTGIYLILSISFNIANVGGEPCDYLVSTELYKSQIFHIELERLRQGGQEFLNTDIYYNHRIGSFGISTRWLHMSGRDLDIYQLGLRWHYTKNLNVGGAIVWENGMPKRKVVIGAQYSTRLNLILLRLQVDASSNIYTGDFRKYSHAEIIRITFDILASLGLYAGVKVEDFNALAWQAKIGLKVNL